MPVKAKIRLDFKAENKSTQFFWQKRNLRETAKNLRAREVSLLRNLPFQGIQIEELNTEQEVYLVPGSANLREAAYAPVEMVVAADSLEDLTQLTLKEEFRKIKVLEPEKLQLSPNEMERFLFKVNEEYRSEIDLLD